MVKTPVELLAKVTDPVGVIGELEISVTVALQDVTWFTIIEAGVQVTLTVVGPTVTLALPVLVL